MFGGRARSGVSLSLARRGATIIVVRQAPTALASFRRHRPTGIAFFVLLVLVVAGERRLADLHFNLRTAAPGLESDDVLDGDEIRVRLIVLADDTPPTVPHVSRAIGFAVVRAPSEAPDSLALGSPAPRGPPVPRALTP